jgi:LPXTG-motif cell wall-anchored protein
MRALFYIACPVFFSLFFCTCKESPENSTTDTETLLVDSLNILYQQQFLSEPELVKQSIFENRAQINDSLNYYLLMNKLPYCYLTENKIDSALWATKIILAFCERQNPKSKRITELEALIYNVLAVIYKVTGEENLAIECLQKAVDRIQQNGNRAKLADAYINLADNYFGKGDFPLAVDYYRKALWLSDSLNMKEHEFSIYIGLGQTYTNLKNYKTADFYYQKVEDKLDSLDKYTQYQFENNRGNHYYLLKEYEKALFWFRQANNTIKGYPSYEAVTEVNLAEIFILQNQPDSAKLYLDKAAKVFLTPESGASPQFYVNGLYASLALTKNDLKEAEKLLTLPYHQEEINPSYIYYNNKRLEEFYAKKGDYKKAYEYKEKVELYDDSILNNTTRNNIAEIEMRYRQDTTLLKRDVIIAQREQQVAELQTNNLIIIAAGISIVLLIIAFLLYYKRKKDVQYSRQITTIANLRMENVRNRISPHFMFNVVNAVLPSLRQQEEMTQPLTLLVKSIRSNLQVSEKMAVPLQEEMDMVHTFIDLRESIGSKPATVRWEIAENVNLDTLIPSMCIQIPVENALKYAFEEYDENNRLLITIVMEKNDYLRIFIEDNGIGFNELQAPNNSKGTGNGLKILYKTIELLNSKNIRKIEFNIQNKKHINQDESGTLVSILVPLHYKYKI